jgi:tetratricopeptide (TPR) repeat protein
MYNRAQYQAVIEELKPYSVQPEALRLTGKSFFMLGDFKKAAEYFHKLVRINPLSSMDFQWLGKTFARRADTANPLRAAGYASRAKTSFERSVELDPSSVGALKELLDIYLDGRGLDKAMEIAGRIGELDPQEGVRAQQKVLLRRQELRTPEEQVRMAIDQFPRKAGRAVDAVSRR